MNVAVVGGGFLGARVARAHPGPAVVVTRTAHPDEPGSSTDRISRHAMDITADSLDIDPLQACTHLLIAVAAAGQDRRGLYVEGTSRLLKATRSIAWRRIVYVSSTSALPDHDGWLFEDEARWPQSERGRVQREAEDVVLEHGRTRAIPTIVLRLGGLYGPGRDLGRVYRRRSAEPVRGDGNAPTNLIHVDDAVQASCAALNAPAHVGGVLHVCDDDHRTRRTMYDEVARARGIEPVQWQTAADPRSAPCGKRVSNLRMKLELGLRLQHPHHVV